MNQLSSSLPGVNSAIQTIQTIPPSTPSLPNIPPPTHHAKLHLLREHDADRNWDSIEDKRTCLLCGSDFSGADIRVRVKKGKPVFECPGILCRGTLRHFVYAGNPLLSEATWSDWMRVNTMHVIDS